MEAIETSIIEGGYDSIKSGYYNMSEYDPKTGGIIYFRRRRGGQTEFMIRDKIIGMGLINKSYFDGLISGDDIDPNLTEFPYVKSAGSAKKSKIKTTNIDIDICKEIANLFGVDININHESSHVLKILKNLYAKSDKMFVKYNVEKFGLVSIVNDALCRLHESIVSRYLHIVKLYAEQFPSKIKKNPNIKDSYPLNYSDNLVKLKAVLFKSKILNEQLDKIQGFCPSESIKRIRQLLDLPIEILIAELDGTFIKVPNIPKISSISFDLDTKIISINEPKKSTIELVCWYAKNILTRQKNLQKYIMKHEQHYIDIAETINLFSNYIEMSY